MRSILRVARPADFATAMAFSAASTLVSVGLTPQTRPTSSSACRPAYSVLAMCRLLVPLEPAHQRAERVRLEAIPVGGALRPCRHSAPRGVDHDGHVAPVVRVDEGLRG